ncbi:MAG: ankyrin repeat domain-containing protein [Sphingomonadales bacterium]|jgi:ankyrin repeat protein
MTLVSALKKLATLAGLGIATLNIVTGAQAQQYSERYEFIKAIKEQDAFAVREKLTNGQYPNVRDGEGVPAIYLAAQQGGIGWVALLLKHDADINIANRSDGKTVLMHFAERGETDAVKFLLGQKADPNITDGFGETALMKAVRARQFRVAKALLSAGSDLNISDSSGRTALDHAINSRDRRMEKLIRDAESES